MLGVVASVCTTCNLVISMVIFGISHSGHTSFQSRISLRFCLKIPSPEFSNKEIPFTEKPIGDREQRMYTISLRICSLVFKTCKYLFKDDGHRQDVDEFPGLPYGQADIQSDCFILWVLTPANVTPPPPQNPSPPKGVATLCEYHPTEYCVDPFCTKNGY